MPEQRRNERDLVLAPNEFAFISDATKGNINVYVGPYKTSLADTDQPVVFNSKTKRFQQRSLQDAVQTFKIAPEGWYVTLKNPANDGTQPKLATVNNLLELNIGRKVNISGPISFPLWPGQMAKVVQGHHLRSNQYIVARVYDQESAKKSWEDAIITPQTETTEGGDPPAKGAKGKDVVKPGQKPPDLSMGQLLVIKGTDVSFYIPPTGIEVVLEGDLTSNIDPTYYHVRDAVTLERLEYCIMVDENGNKRFERGPAVVFPNPTERFLERKDPKGRKSRKFRAIELNEQMGIYIKVIADYQETEAEGGKKYRAGDERFITGEDTKIYFPREEHAIVKYDNKEINYAITIPAGEGRYVLNKDTGAVELISGPKMFLPDPRTQVVVRRVLNPKTVELMYPGNQEAIQHNIALQTLQANMGLGDQEYMTKNMSDLGLTGGGVSGAAYAMASAAPAFDTGILEESAETPDESARVLRKAMHARSRAVKDFAGDDFERETSYTPPRTIQLDTKYEGAVRVGIWTGYAIQVVSTTGDRRVVVGPATELLQYNESLEVIELSKGTPKTDKNLKRTVYLRCRNNKVSDIIEAETKDRVQVNVLVSYRVNFEGEAEKWFEVENYVKFLTDHCRSMIRNKVKGLGIESFDADPINIVRNTILGAVKEGKREGRGFEENGMRIYDVEVLNVTIGDRRISELLVETQHSAVKQTLDIAHRERTLEVVKRAEAINQETEQVKADTVQKSNELTQLRLMQELEIRLFEIESTVKQEIARREATAAAQKELDEITKAENGRELSNRMVGIDSMKAELELRLKSLNAEKDAWVAKATAIAPKLVEALQGFSDKEAAGRIAEALGPLTLLGGDSASDILNKVLKGTRLEGVLFRPDGGSTPLLPDSTDGGSGGNADPKKRAPRRKTPSA